MVENNDQRQNLGSIDKILQFSAIKKGFGDESQHLILHPAVQHWKGTALRPGPWLTVNWPRWVRLRCVSPSPRPQTVGVVPTGRIAQIWTNSGSRQAPSLSNHPSHGLLRAQTNKIWQVFQLFLAFFPLLRILRSFLYLSSYVEKHGRGFAWPNVSDE